MQKIRCLIVDDEELARRLLETYIGRLPFLELVGQCKNPLEAMSVLRSQAVDVLFLDIQMPELSGVDFLRTLSTKPLTILTTAYADYALEGYTLDVVDYLLKPIGFERFVQAVNRAGDRLAPRAVAPAVAVPVMTEPAATKDFILVKSDHKLHRLAYDDILYIESMREYVAYHTASTGRIVSLGSLKALETELPAERFVRIHKSYMIALDKFKLLEGNILHVGSVRLPIGSMYKDEVVKRVFG